MGEIVFLNGHFIRAEDAVISVEDRGNLFADGVYEVVRFYGGRPFQLEAHLTRLGRSAAAIRLPLPMEREEFAAAAKELVECNGLLDASLYLQVSRGAAPRQHHFPANVQPTVFMIARPIHPQVYELRCSGVECIYYPRGSPLEPLSRQSVGSAAQRISETRGEGGRRVRGNSRPRRYRY